MVHLGQKLVLEGLLCEHLEENVVITRTQHWVTRIEPHQANPISPPSSFFVLWYSWAESPEKSTELCVWISAKHMINDKPLMILLKIRKKGGLDSQIVKILRNCQKVYKGQ